VISVGGVRSDHHQVNVRVRSVLDNADAEAAAAAAEQAPLRDDCLRSVAGGVCASQGQVRALSCMPRFPLGVRSLPCVPLSPLGVR
jgi:hypothetical protein